MIKAEQQRVLKEEAYTYDYLRQSIELGEKAGNADTNYALLEKLMKLDLEEEGADNLEEEDEAELFAVLQSDGVGKAVTNLAEYLLLTQAMKGEIKVGSCPFDKRPGQL